MKKVKILVCCHKKDLMLDVDPYFPIHVGKNNSDLEMNMQGDNTGDNISSKNYSYCELTAMYWAWKNMKDIDYIGLCHYRRYFDFHNNTSAFRSSSTMKSSDFNNVDFSIPSNVMDFVAKGGVVLAKHQIYRCSNFMEYCCYHISDDMRVLKTVIDEHCETKYADAFTEVMLRENHLCPFNMFIMKKSDFDRYCEWLFSLLFEVEKQIDISAYSPYQSRIFGFMAERLLNVYMKAEGKQVMEKPILFFNDKDDLKNTTMLKNLINKVRADLSFMFIKPKKNAKM